MVLLQFWKTWTFLLAPILLLPILWIDPEQIIPMRMLYILCLMGLYWMTSVLPLPITSLIPLAAFPLAEIADTKDVGTKYFNATLFVFMGGIVLAIVVEETGLHRRIALNVLKISFLRKRSWGIMIGFMIVTAFLSMFISNTATVAMMIPIVDAVCNALYKNQKMDHKKRDMLLLSVAYSANIGGTGFITGSPPNLLVLTQLKDSSVTFLTWVFFCVPLVICNLIVAFLWLQIFSYIINKWNWLSPDPQRVQWYDQNRQMKIENHVETNEMINQHSSEMRGCQSNNTGLGVSMASLQTNLSSNEDQLDSVKKYTRSENKESKIVVSEQKHGSEINKELEHSNNPSDQERVDQVLQQELKDVGQIKSSEIMVALSFILLIILWFTKSPKFAPGWSSVLKGTNNDGENVSVGSVVPAIAIVILIFILPKTWSFWPFTSIKNSKSSDGLVTWNTIEKKMPWGVLILLGGGFTLSYGCNKSGLSRWIATKMTGLKSWPQVWMNFGISCFAALMTEFVSNTATANILAPILKELSLSVCINPIYLIVTTVISCSYAFMLPVATAPNALVFDASTMKNTFMMTIGFGMNIFCVSLTNLAINLYGEAIFEDFDTIPDWATPTSESLALVANCTVN